MSDRDSRGGDGSPGRIGHGPGNAAIQHLAAGGRSCNECEEDADDCDSGHSPNVAVAHYPPPRCFIRPDTQRVDGNIPPLLLRGRHCAAEAHSGTEHRTSDRAYCPLLQHLRAIMVVSGRLSSRQARIRVLGRPRANVGAGRLVELSGFICLIGWTLSAMMQFEWRGWPSRETTTYDLRGELDDC